MIPTILRNLRLSTRRELPEPNELLDSIDIESDHDEEFETTEIQEAESQEQECH
jgi:hypothetical protein